MGKTPETPILEIKVICRNRRAKHDFYIEDTMEAGIVLIGSEVKSLRAGHVDLSDSYASFLDGELYLVGLHIAPYEKASRFGHEPRRKRKLLLHKQVLKRLGIKVSERGYTLVPLEVYFKRGIVKVLVALAKGRKQHDDRDVIRKKEERREMREAAGR